MTNNPKLYLIPTPIGEQNPLDALPSETLSRLPDIRHFLVENLRSARRFLKAAAYQHDFDSVTFYEINEHNQYQVNLEWIQPLLDGHHLGLLSEAGVPCVADPGYTVVRLAHEKGFEVVPLGGPTSILKALMASGLNGQQFTFHGYLPVKPDELKRQLKKIEDSAKNGYTQIFIETPYRNDRMFDIIISTCQHNTLLCIASAIDTDQQKINTLPVLTWKKNKPELKGKPCVFLLGY
jgi:16S rRNA (cytidine1402-2'-O)-methyltransferase